MNAITITLFTRIGKEVHTASDYMEAHRMVCYLLSEHRFRAHDDDYEEVFFATLEDDDGVYEMYTADGVSHDVWLDDREEH